MKRQNYFSSFSCGWIGSKLLHGQCIGGSKRVFPWQIFVAGSSSECMVHANMDLIWMVGRISLASPVMMKAFAFFIVMMKLPCL